MTWTFDGPCFPWKITAKAIYWKFGSFAIILTVDGATVGSSWFARNKWTSNQILAYVTTGNTKTVNSVCLFAHINHTIRLPWKTNSHRKSCWNEWRRKFWKELWLLIVYNKLQPSDFLDFNRYEIVRSYEVAIIPYDFD